MDPSKCVVVQAWMRSGEPFICFRFFFVSELSLANLSRQVSILSYLHDVFTVGTTVSPKVDGRLYDGAEQTCA